MGIRFGCFRWSQFDLDVIIVVLVAVLFVVVVVNGLGKGR